MKSLLTAATLLLSCAALSPFQALAEVAESYKCKMNTGVTRAQIVDMGESYIKVGEAKNYTDFHLSILFPMYSDDMSVGTFFWNGTSPSMATLEEAITIWESTDNAEAQALWVQYVADCESASLYSAVSVN
jgi:hypothetical protein